jgi:hypothetical protein
MNKALCRLISSAAVKRRSMTRSRGPVLVLLTFASVLVAQIQEGARDNCDLSVRVRTANERTIESPVQVQVLSPQGVIATVQINGDDPPNLESQPGGPTI